MKTSSLTIRLDKNLNGLLTKVARRSGRSKSDIARELLQRHLRIYEFDALQKRLMLFAGVRGYLTDKDVFDRVS